MAAAAAMVGVEFDALFCDSVLNLRFSVLSWMLPRQFNREIQRGHEYMRKMQYEKKIK